MEAPAGKSRSSNLIGALAGRYAGPILVVGGGIRAPAEWEKVRGEDFKCIISANSHGFRLPGCKPDFIWANDTIHSETKESMEALLRPYGVPILSRHWWADYRAAEWDVSGNSGMAAIAAAVILGGHPVVAIGFDCFQEGTHFWEPSAQNVNAGKPLYAFSPRVQKLAERLQGATITALSGPLLRQFMLWEPGKSYPPRKYPIQLVDSHAEKEQYPVEAVQEFTMPFDRRAEIPVGAQFVMSAEEIDRALRLGDVKALGAVPKVKSQSQRDIERMRNMSFRKTVT